MLVFCIRLETPESKDYVLLFIYLCIYRILQVEHNNRVDELLDRLTRKKEKQIANIRNRSGHVTTDI